MYQKCYTILTWPSIQTAECGMVLMKLVLRVAHYGPWMFLLTMLTLLSCLFVVFLEDFAICALPYVQYAKGSSQAISGLSYGPQQLPSHPATQCYPKRWSVPPLAWCLHLAQLGPNEDPREPLQHWKRGLASQTGSLYDLLHATVVHEFIGYPPPHTLKPLNVL